MCKNHIFRGIEMLVVTSLLFFSCRNDSDDYKEEALHDYDVIVKSAETDYADINRVMLYVFDSGRKLTGGQETVLNQEVKLKYSTGQKFTVIAWGYTAGQTLPRVANGTSIDDVLLTLDTTVFAGQTIAISPSDLFYGQLSIDEPYMNACSEVKEYILWTKRQVASVSIVTHNLQHTLQTTDTNFSYVLSATPSSISFSDIFSGSSVGYHPPVKFDIQRDYLTAPKFYTFPTGAANPFRLDIYHGNQLLKSFFQDDNDSDFRLQEGKHHLIWIEYSGSSSPDISITLKVNNWNNKDISEEF